MSAPDPRFLIAIPPREPMDGALGPIGRKTAATQNPHAECLAKLESSP
jgi:hypothetical protein